MLSAATRRTTFHSTLWPLSKRSGKVVFHDLRIDVFELVECLRPRIADAIGGPGNEPQEISGAPVAEVQKWTTKGDPLPDIIDWARTRWGEDLDKLPNSQGLLAAHRTDFGEIRGINERTMRPVRAALANTKAKKGGAPTHRF